MQALQLMRHGLSCRGFGGFGGMDKQLQVRIQQLLTRWGLLQVTVCQFNFCFLLLSAAFVLRCIAAQPHQDKVTRYVLESLTPAELQAMPVPDIEHH